MKKKMWIIYLIPFIFLLFSITLMNSASFLKNPLSEDDRLLESVKTMESNVKKKEWKQANNEIRYASIAWKKIVNRIQYSVEREYMYQVSETLARIEGGIKVEDDKAIMGEIYFFYDLWEELGK